MEHFFYRCSWPHVCSSSCPPGPTSRPTYPLSNVFQSHWRVGMSVWGIGAQTQAQLYKLIFKFYFVLFPQAKSTNCYNEKQQSMSITTSLLISICAKNIHYLVVMNHSSMKFQIHSSKKFQIHTQHHLFVLIIINKEIPLP